MQGKKLLYKPKQSISNAASDDYFLKNDIIISVIVEKRYWQRVSLE